MTIQTPVLLDVELQGAVIVLSVQALDGRAVKLRCGGGEAYRVRSWQWLRNRSDDQNGHEPCGFLGFTEQGGREFRFAVPTETQLTEFQLRMRRPLA